MLTIILRRSMRCEPSRPDTLEMSCRGRSSAKLTSIDRWSPHIFKQANWIDQIILLHVFDHPVMSAAGWRPRKMYTPLNSPLTFNGHNRQQA